MRKISMMPDINIDPMGNNSTMADTEFLTAILSMGKRVQKAPVKYMLMVLETLIVLAGADPANC